MTTESNLTPQDPRPTRQRRRVIPLVAAGALVAGVMLLIWNLVSGSLYFYNADEAVARRSELGAERFVLQGSPIGCSIVESALGSETVVAFSLSFGGRTVDVVHRGDPADLFQPDVPVVLDGNWVEGSPEVEGFAGMAGDGWYFASDRMRVKHDNDYRNDEDYEQRLQQSEAQAATGGCS
jgi:cytochrome c-type biogenesis protein CcmE